MAKTKAAYVCQECGADHARWLGQCNACGAWNTVSEVRLADIKAPKVSVGKSLSESRSEGGYAGESDASLYSIDEVDTTEGRRINTGYDEFNRVLGGGVTEGSIVLLTGDPGAGKTTLLTQTAEYISKDMPSLYNTAEESLPQFKNRAVGRMKLNFNKKNMKFGHSSVLEEIIAMVEKCGAKVLYLDSIQAIRSNEHSGDAGSTGQVKHCAMKLNRFCKQNDITLFMIGHVTKDNSMAGPKVLEHVIDTSIHIYVSDSLRTLRPHKNRFGNTDQIGLFQMHERGMVSVDNPSKIFLTRSERDYSGLAATCVRDGARNLLLEVQSLVTEVKGEKCTTSTIGIHYSRLSMISAVMSKSMKMNMYKDVNVQLVGGIKLPETETSTDLALAAALYSSDKDIVIPRGMCLFGELSLTGEIRPVAGGVPRVAEAAKVGFETIVIPKRNFAPEMKNENINVITIEHLSELKDILG